MAEEDENRHPVEPTAEGRHAHMHGFVKAVYCVAASLVNHGDILRVSALSRAAPLAGKTAVVSTITGVTPGQDAGVRSGDWHGGPSLVRAGGYTAVPAWDEESAHARLIVVTKNEFPRHGPYH